MSLQSHRLISGASVTITIFELFLILTGCPYLPGSRLLTLYPVFPSGELLKQQFPNDTLQVEKEGIIMTVSGNIVYDVNRGPLGFNSGGFELRAHNKRKENITFKKTGLSLNIDGRNVPQLPDIIVWKSETYSMEAAPMTMDAEMVEIPQGKSRVIGLLYRTCRPWPACVSPFPAKHHITIPRSEVILGIDGIEGTETGDKISFVFRFIPDVGK